MNFEHTDKVKELMARIEAFMQEHIYPNEEAYEEFTTDPANLWIVPPIMEELKARAKAEGLWNSSCLKEYGEFSPGLTNLEYAPSGRTDGPRGICQ